MNYILFVLGNGLFMGLVAVIYRFPPWFTLIATICINLIAWKTIFCPHL